MSVTNVHSSAPVGAKTCPACQGSGVDQQQQDDPHPRRCADCSGSGRIKAKPVFGSTHISDTDFSKWIREVESRVPKK